MQDQEAFRTLLKARLVHQITVVIGISLVKISVALFLLRLATRRAYLWFLHSTIVFLILFTMACMGTLVSTQRRNCMNLGLSSVANIATQIFQCNPVEAAWDYRLRPAPFGTGDAKCFSMETFAALGLFNGG